MDKTEPEAGGEEVRPAPMTRDEALRAAPEDVATGIEEFPAADGAHLLSELPAQQAADVAEALDPVTAARILAEMDAQLAATVIQDMETPEASQVLARMDPDDRVDILENIDTPLQDRLLGEMPAEAQAETRNLAQYPPNTAGGRMNPQVTALYEYITVDNAITLLRKLHEEMEQMFYVYVINRRRQLVGVLSMRDLILARPTRPLTEIMIRNVKSVPADMDQAEVARLMRKYGYLAVPVVGPENELLGLITLDDLLDIIEEETTEDVQRMFGAGAEERLTTPWSFSFQKRVWWLLINLATAFLAGWVVSMFDSTIERAAVLAVYMPIVAGMGGNASAQAMAVAVRGISTGRVDRKVIRHVLLREVYVGLFTGIVCGLVTGIIALVWQQNPALGFVVAAALAINHTLACTSGAGIPFLMKKLGFDPAQSATIFATTVTDVVGFFTLLGLASVFIKFLQN
jgi:magnesium transporter